MSRAIRCCIRVVFYVVEKMALYRNLPGAGGVSGDGNRRLGARIDRRAREAYHNPPDGNSRRPIL